jgi:predicted O-methyltransferase YrrM
VTSGRGAGISPVWTGEDEFSIGPVSYGCRRHPQSFRSSDDRVCICKPREVIERWKQLICRLAPRRIFEVGVFEGGSTAMLAQLAKPERLLSVDIEFRAKRALAEFAAQQGIAKILRPHWGVDQADVERLRSILDAELSGAPLDLVVDDASHLLEPSRASFDTLFPRLRPGGEYIIEDWG